MLKSIREECRLSEDRSTTGDRAEGAAATGWRERRRLPEKLSSLRRKLYQKAEREPRFRFYALYDRIYRPDVLWAAWEQVRANKGAAGVDGVTIDRIVDAEDGPEQLVETLHEELRCKRYRPGPVRRVEIPKPGGGSRPLGIPDVRDRVVQTAAALVLEPIFEADFTDCSYGFRPGRNAHQALEAVREHLRAGYRDVYDADLKGYFDTIPHDKLMAALRMRIADRSVLKLIRQWLKAPIQGEEGGPGGRRERGTPQGGVISPLLANIYLHWFEVFFHARGGPARWANAKLVRYADDFLILARYQGERLRAWVEEVIETRMGLTINREKTRVVQLNQAGATVDFLGYTYRYDRDRHGRGHHYLNVFPSKKAVAKERQRLRELTCAQVCFKPLPHLIRHLNVHRQGWAHYFSFGYPRKAYRDLNRYTDQRLTVHLRRRSQRRYRPPGNVSLYRHFADLGLVRL